MGRSGSTNQGNKLQEALKDIEKIKSKMDEAMGEKASLKKEKEKPTIDFVANGQRYNEEEPENRNYYSCTEYEVKADFNGGGKLSYGPTKFLPQILKNYVDVSVYAKFTYNVELIKSAKFRRVNGVEKEKIDEQNSGVKLQAVGGLAIGANAEIKASKALKFELDASGKAEIEGSVASTFSNELVIVATLKPLVFNFSVSASIAGIPICQYNYIKNITNEYTIYDSTKNK